MSSEAKEDQKDCTVPNPYTITIERVEQVNNMPLPIDCIEILYRQNSTPQTTLPIQTFLPKILKKEVDENLIDEVYNQIQNNKNKTLHKSSNILVIKGMSQLSSPNE